MNKILLKSYEIEYKTTNISINDLCDKYQITTKDLKGHKKWEKNLLNPQTPREKEQHIDTHIDIAYNDYLTRTQQPEDYEVPPDLNEIPTKDELLQDLKPEETEVILESKVLQASTEVISNDITLDVHLEGLKKLDLANQKLATYILKRTHAALALDTEPTARDLVSYSQVSKNIKESFSNKAPVVNFFSGQMREEDSLAERLSKYEDDV